MKNQLKPGYIRARESCQDITGTWSKNKPKVAQEKCIKCYMCWLNCPEGAIKVNKYGQIEVDENICKGCGICESICPKNAIKLENK